MMLRNKAAYRQVVGDFVTRTIGAEDFLSGFAQLWLRDRAAPVDDGRPGGLPAPDEARLLSLLGDIDALCATYTRSLLPGREYRVSAAQFRREVEARVHGSTLLGSRPP
jgi:hypothetical protein